LIFTLSEILNSLKISFEDKTIFASHFKIKLLHQTEFCLKISQGTAKTSFHKSRASLAVISDPDFSFASTITLQTESQATISFLIGKL
jgi:hypothetical protein